MFRSNTKESISGVSVCQAPASCTALIVPTAFECLAPSQVTAQGKIDYPCTVRKRYAGGRKKSVYRDGALRAITVPYDGALCGGCDWSHFFVPDIPHPPTPLLVPHSVQSQENKWVKKSRFLVRAFRGVACGIVKEYRFRWFVLTESDAAIASNIDFGKEFNKFVVWLRYYCPDFAYIVVEHRQGNLKRRNWHIISYGSDRLPVLKIREYWLKHFKSTVTGMAEIKDIRESVYYVCGYVSGEGFIRSWSSQNWVFKGWLGVAKEYKRRYGDYPSYSDLESISRLDKSSRGCALMWLLESGFIDEQALIDGGNGNGKVDTVKGRCRS